MNEFAHHGNHHYSRPSLAVLIVKFTVVFKFQPNGRVAVRRVKAKAENQSLMALLLQDRTFTLTDG